MPLKDQKCKQEESNKPGATLNIKNECHLGVREKKEARVHKTKTIRPVYQRDNSACPGTDPGRLCVS